VLGLLRSTLPCDTNVNNFSNAYSDCLRNECEFVLLAHRHVEQTGVGAVRLATALSVRYNTDRLTISPDRQAAYTQLSNTTSSFVCQNDSGFGPGDSEVPKIY